MVQKPKKNKTVTEEIHIKKYKIGTISMDGFGFDYEYELVPGKWTFQIYYKDQKLLEKTFNVYQP